MLEDGFIRDKPWSVKPEMDTAVHLPQFNNSETAIAYYTVCSIFIAILEKFPVLHNLYYRWKFNCTTKLHESQLGSAVTPF